MRTTLLLVCALMIGAAAGGLTYFSTLDIAGAALAGGCAFGASLLWLDKVVGR